MDDALNRTPVLLVVFLAWHLFGDLSERNTVYSCGHFHAKKIKGTLKLASNNNSGCCLPSRNWSKTTPKFLALVIRALLRVPSRKPLSLIKIT